MSDLDRKQHLRYLEKEEKLKEYRKKQYDENCKVYFVESDGLMKIGSSEYPDSRVRELRCGNPHIRLVGYIKGNTKVEHRLHKKFKNFKIKGEWFHATHDVYSAIYKLLDGDTDYDTVVERTGLTSLGEEY